jgi:hypothetical protein
MSELAASNSAPRWLDKRTRGGGIQGMGTLILREVVSNAVDTSIVRQCNDGPKATALTCIAPTTTLMALHTVSIPVVVSEPRQGMT